MAEQIIQKGYFSRPFMGINFQPIAPDISHVYNLPVQWGAYLTSVSANSPASQAGPQTGDIITSIGGVTLDETHSFVNTLFTYKPGDQITVEFMRNGNSQQVQMRLGESRHGS